MSDYLEKKVHKINASQKVRFIKFQEKKFLKKKRRGKKKVLGK